MADDETEEEAGILEKVPKHIKAFLDKLNPIDLAIFLSGFWVGYRFHLKPGFTFPLIPGVAPLYLGLPDVEGIPVRVVGYYIPGPGAGWSSGAWPQAALLTALETNRLAIEEMQLLIAAELAQGRAPNDPPLPEYRSRMATFQLAVNYLTVKMRPYWIGQGLEMGIFALTVSRPGFLTGVGSILQGVGEIIPL